MSDNTNYKRPLMSGETESLTIGCRHSNPNICRKNGQENVCALFRADNICTSPPSSWVKRFEELNKNK